MTCFDLENTLYVRNKWDRLHVGIQTQEEIKMKLTDQMNAEWPRMIESNIFDTCLKKVCINFNYITFSNNIDCIIRVWINT